MGNRFGNKGSPEYRTIVEMRPGDVERIAHPDRYCVQQGRGKNSCSITRMVWNINRRHSDRVYRARHEGEGVVVVRCIPAGDLGVPEASRP